MINTHLNFLTQITRKRHFSNQRFDVTHSDHSTSYGHQFTLIQKQVLIILSWCFNTLARTNYRLLTYAFLPQNEEPSQQNSSVQRTRNVFLNKIVTLEEHSKTKLFIRPSFWPMELHLIYLLLYFLPQLPQKTGWSQKIGVGDSLIFSGLKAIDNNF